MIDYRVGDTRDVTRDIPDRHVGLVACSPPFVALRSYLPAEHPLKHAEIGSEPDPATFIATLLELTAEWGRVLAPWGSIAIELGDTYSGSGGAGGDYNDNGLRAGQQKFAGPALKAGEWPLPKSLALVPQAYALSLAYGRNVLTGQPSPAGQWRVRNQIVWHRPNPAVGALSDKFRPSTSYITVATRSERRWFDLTAVRTTPTIDPAKMMPGAPPLDAWFDQHDTWTITTQPSRLAHYAMWPPRLAERLILSMCPQQVCATCGEPRRRVERTSNAVGKAVATTNAIMAHPKYAGRTDLIDVNANAPDRSERETLGWTDCGHDNYRPGVVLDPFAGTGTTLCVAEIHGRDSIGIDIDERNRDLLEPRMMEVRKALLGVTPELPGQLAMFGGEA